MELGRWLQTRSTSPTTCAACREALYSRRQLGHFRNNISVFFIQDAIKSPDVVHAVKEKPNPAFPSAQSTYDNFWDIITLTPASMHMIMWVMSNPAIPCSFRFVQGLNTFRFLNAKDESTFVKFHWKPKLGLQSVADQRR